MGTGLGIYELVPDAREMSAEAFELKYGSVFLIRTLDDGNLSSADGFNRASTAVVNPGALERQTSRLETPEATYIYPLAPRSPGDALRVGRLSDCDICISDKSLSKHHADILLRSDGTLAVIDRSSKNGTRIGPERIDPGIATAVQFGKTITFGGVRFTYLPVRQLIDFIQATFDVEEDLQFDIEFDDGGS